MKNFLFALALLLILPSQVYALGNPVVSIQSAAAESSHVLKASGGSLFGFSATSGATAGYVMLFDSATAPSDGTVTPKLCYSIPASSTTGASWIDYPLAFNTGIVAVFSTTGCFTKTASATAFFNAQVQ